MTCVRIYQMDAKIVFMGSPDFALPSLEELNKSFNVVGVVTQPDRPAGRGRKLRSPAVKVLAGELSIPVIQPQSLTEGEALQQLKAWEPDVIVVAAFGQILRSDVLELPRCGCVNVHASLLPRWRGASPIQAAILNGDAVTGITIMKMDEGLDSGPILTQREISISEDMTGGSLSERLAILGAKTLVEILPSYLSGMIAPLAQDDSKVTYARRLKKAAGLLNLDEPAERLVRQVRAYNPWPGAFLNLRGKVLKVHEAHVHNTYDCDKGLHYIVNGSPALGTSKGLFVLDVVQPAGRKSMTGGAYLNGIKDWLQEEV